MNGLATSDYRSTGKRAEGGFRLAWPFKADAIQRIKDILFAEQEGSGVGTVVHGFSGASPPLVHHEVRVDLHHPDATLKIDVADLDKHVQNAAVVVIDPPYGGNVATKQRILARSEEHTSELQSRRDLVCRLLLEKKKTNK